MKSSRRPTETQLAYALGAAAGAVPPGIVISRADLLRRSGREAAATEHLTGAVTRHPALAVGLLATLRAAGRTADIGFLLDAFALTEPEVCSRIVLAFTASRDAADLELLLDRLGRRGIADLAVIAVACRDASAEQRPRPAAEVDPITARLLTRPVRELCVAIGDLRHAGRDPEADAVLSAVIHGSGLVVREAAVLLAEQGQLSEAASLLRRHASVAEPVDLAAHYCELAERWPSAAALLVPVMVGRADAPSLLAALRSADSRRFPGLFLEQLSAERVAELCASLWAENADAELDAVLDWCAGWKDAAALRVVFHDSAQHALAYRLAALMDEVTWTPGP